MAKVESTREYLNANIEELSIEFQEVMKENRRLYELMKANTVKAVAVLKKELPMPQGKEVVGIGFTRWGQFQIHVDKIKLQKPAAVRRLSLSEFVAAQGVSGGRV